MKKLTEEEMSQVNGGLSSCARGLILTGAGVVLTVIAVGTGPVGWGILAGTALNTLNLMNAAYDCGTSQYYPIDNEIGMGSQIER